MVGSTKLQFLEFTFDVETGELVRDNAATRLQPQPAAALRLLVSSPGELVTRDALKRELWPDTIVETDQGLNFCIRQIRQALGDDVEGGRFIETLPRRGYRFLPAVHAVGALEYRAPARNAPNADANDQKKTDDARVEPDSETITGGSGTTDVAKNLPSEILAPGKPVRMRRIILAAIAVIVVVGPFMLQRKVAAMPAIPIAVVPLATRESTNWADERNRQLTDALVEELTNASSPKLAVIGPVTTAPLVATQMQHTQIGTQLNAMYVLSGGVRMSDSTIFIQAIRSSDGVHVFAWREPLNNRDAKSLAELIVLALQQKLRLQ